MEEDYVIYTSSDPDAADIADYLVSKGFLVGDLSDQAIVLVWETTKKKLVSALRAMSKSTMETWKIAKVGKSVKL